MAVTALRPMPKFQALDLNGNPLAGGKLYTYSAGTTSALATYTDSTGTVANANPVILDSRGEASVWFQPLNYKLVLKDANDNTIWTQDNYSGSPYPITDEWITYIHTWTFVDATHVTVPGDQTAIYQVNKAIRAVCTAGTYYGNITASAYDGSTKTTLTVSFDVGSFDSGVGGSSTISIGVQSSQSPALIAAGQASTSATNAATSASAAATSATAAAASASAASTSATNAASSASSASTSASTATTKASEASTSATNAASSASSASTSASTATTQASNAATSATNASNSASAASTSATNASNSASAAATSATNASNSASAASTSATNAANSATAAAASAASIASGPVVSINGMTGVVTGIATQAGVEELTNKTVNKYTFTPPATGATLVIADGKTFTTSNTLTLSGTDGTTMTFPATSDTIAGLGTAQKFTKAQRGAVVTLTDAATVALDLSLANQFAVRLGGNRTLGAPTNAVAGQSGSIEVIQDTTGSRTLAYAWPYVWAGGSVGTLTTAGCSMDQLVYEVSTYASSAVTISIATPGVVSWTGHGLVTGQRVQLTTTGALPTGLSANTTYYWTTVDANSGKLSTSLANCAAGTFITTSGTQSGTHTMTAATIKLALNKAYA